MYRQRMHKGFTLIELLVVIAIIAILAAILFPIFSQAKDAGRRARCANNEKQLVCALQNYVDDYGGRLPSFYSTSAWNTSGTGCRSSRTTARKRSR